MASPLQNTNIPIQNSGFEQSNSLPPTGWQPVTTGWGPPSSGQLTLAYETADPYDGLQSLELTATDQFIGVASIAPSGALAISCKSGEYYQISGALRYVSGGMQPRITAQFWSSVSGAMLGEVVLLATLTDNIWHFGSVVSAVPWGSMIVDGNTVVDFADTLYIVVDCQRISGASTTTWEVDDVSCVKISAIDYYLSLLTSLYQGAPKLKAWLSVPLGILSQLIYCIQGMSNNFDISEAVGPQLDIIGELVGASRTLPFQPVSAGLLSCIWGGGSGYAAGDEYGVSYPGASGGKVLLSPGTGGALFNVSVIAPGSNYAIGTAALTGSPGTGGNINIQQVTQDYSSILDDDHYRILLLAKIAQNQWDGKPDSLYSLWQQLFPGGLIKILDNQNMTATIILAGTFDNLMQQIITNGLIIPRPEGVLYNYVFSELPIFGFDGDGVNISGFDTGHWA
jgi:hypothetical protein